MSRQGGTGPLWSRDGRQLFFRSPSKFWVVDVQADGSFEGSKPRLLFENSGYTRSTPFRSWDISLDSQRFLMVKIEERKPTPITKLTLVQNWLAELP